MQYKILILAIFLVSSFSFSPNTIPVASSVEKNISSHSLETKAPEMSFDEKVNLLYERFSSKNTTMPSLASFKNAMRGYHRLLENEKIENEVLTIVDFSLPSTEKRMWILDMAANKILFHTYVAHGQKTGFDMATKFSNTSNSHQSSLGFYLTAETYIGKHGLSLRMDGLEKGFNSNARARYIVVHGADYATPDFIERVGRLGRSYGCPAVPAKLSGDIIKTIKEKSCFFIYYPSEKYLENSRFLNYKIA